MSTHVYKGYLIWRDATRWVVRVPPWGDQSGEATARFHTFGGAKAYVDRNPRNQEEGLCLK